MIYPDNFEIKIEFDAIRRMLKEYTLCRLGEERVDDMQFMTDFKSINCRLDEVVEFVRLLQLEQNFPSDHYFDVREPLQRIRIEGMYMGEEELFSLRRSLDTISRMLTLLRKQGNGSESGDDNPLYPNLRRLAGDIDILPSLLRAIDGIVDKFGKVKDSASPTLASLRSELSRTAGSISRTLNTILRRAQAEGLVEKDASPTLRDGRLVIPVAPALKRKMNGIIHDESASGKTVFIEPAEVVQANNRIRELEAEERREVIRILVAFSDELRPHVPSLLAAYDFLGEIDFIRAKAQLAMRFDAVKPAMSNRPIIDWGAACHP